VSISSSYGKHIIPGTCRVLVSSCGAIVCAAAFDGVDWLIELSPLPSPARVLLSLILGFKNIPIKAYLIFKEDELLFIRSE
jgi:hypothetical protein